MFVLDYIGLVTSMAQHPEDSGQVQLPYTPVGSCTLCKTGASIGFSFRYYMDGIVENDSVKMLSLNGVYPFAENIQSKRYPIVTQFYAIYRADNENPNVKILIDWLLSDDGQTLIEQCGYVRLK